MGVVWPKEQPGFWLGPARRSVRESGRCDELDALRRHPLSGVAVCHMGQHVTLRGDGSLECLVNSAAHEDTLYACTTGLELYECPAADACEGGSFEPHAVHYIEVGTWLHAFRRLDELRGSARHVTEEPNSTCRAGHTGVLCAQCEPGFVLNKQMLCDACPESRAVMYLLAVAILVGLVLLFSHIDGDVATDGADNVESEGCLSKCHCRCLKRAPEHPARRRMPRTPTPSQYVKALVKGMIEQPDKVMLLVSFTQIMSEFSQTYDISWPASLNQAFDVSGLWAGCLWPPPSQRDQELT